MLAGMTSQILLGIATGYSETYELHLLYRCSVAATCSMMCIGIMIGEVSINLFYVIDNLFYIFFLFQ